MIDAAQIRQHAEIISADGIHVGTVDRVEGDRIKLTKKDSGAGHQGHHHFISQALLSGVENNRIRQSANGDVAVSFEEEGDASSVH